MRKIYIVPNLVTTGNMLCGFYSVVSAFHGEFLTAAWAMLAATVFDMMDGRIARLAKATSQFGVEYDSLSDLVSFGVAPALLLYLWALEPFGRFGWMVAFLFMVSGALRLARFNVSSAQAPKAFFQGLPIPIAAGSISTFVIFEDAIGSKGWFEDRALLVLIQSISLSLLMVSSIRFPSFKELNWRSRASFGYLMGIVLSTILIATKPEIWLFVLNFSYISMTLMWRGWRAVAGPSRTERVRAVRALAQMEASRHGQGD
jgi:CDP-diacylglycerol--serine O-phosphatidyltransferase